MYKEGKKAFKSIIESRVFGLISVNVRAEDAIRIFLPPVEESNIMVSTPLPKERQEWIRGFNDAKAEYNGTDNI